MSVLTSSGDEIQDCGYCGAMQKEAAACMCDKSEMHQGMLQEQRQQQAKVVAKAPHSELTELMKEMQQNKNARGERINY